MDVIGRGARVVGNARRSRVYGGYGGQPLYSPRLRMSVIGVVVTALFGALFIRLWYLQVIRGPQGQLAAFTNTVRTVTTPGPRGLVVTRDGKVLVGNQTRLAVTLDRLAAQQEPWIVPKVAKLIGRTPAQVKAALNNNQYSPYAPVPLAVGVPLATVIRLRENQSSYPGVGVELETFRYYPQGATAAHIAGYVGPISAAQLAALKSKGYQAGQQVGEAGVEYTFERWLRGHAGTTKVRVDASGNVVGTVAKTPPAPGNTVVLSLDMGLQKAVDSALANEISTLRSHGFPAQGGASVVLDPNNGQVLAMASFPTYNPSVWAGGISSANYQALSAPASNYPLLNRAIQGLYTPGSTFKLATATAALKYGLIGPSSIIVDSTRYFQVPGCTVGKCQFFDMAEPYPAGPMTVSYALSASNDIFFYTLGYRFWSAWINSHQFGPTPIQNVAQLYGFGTPNGTGIDLPGELGGAVDSLAVRQYNHTHYPQAFPYPASWYAGDNIEMAFGQAGTVVTPLEIADAYATFANGGTRYAPQVAVAAVSPTGKVLKRFEPKVIDHITLPPQDRQALVAGFTGAVTQPWGTAYNTFLGFPFSQLSVAGKTGTASHTGEKPGSLFVAFAPVNHPQYVVATVISQAGYGATGAAVATRQILQYLAAHPVSPVKLP